MKAGSSSTWFPKNNQDVSKQICGLMIDILPVCSVSWMAGRSFRRTSMPRREEARWSGSWQAFGRKRRNREREVRFFCDLVHDQKNSSGDTEPQSCFIFLFLYTYRERLASIDPLDLHNTQPSSAVITLSTDASMIFSVTSGLKYNK